MKTIRIVLLSLAALLAAPLVVSGQGRSEPSSGPLVEAGPAEAGMSAERLRHIDRILETAIQEKRLPGAVALVARRGRIVYYKAFGLADSQANRPLRRDDIFRIASQTKAITATAVMMLWEEGRFQLDDPIAKWIPEFKNAGVLREFNEADGTWTTEPARQPITIRHLLTHTSGIGYGIIDSDPRFKAIYGKAGITDLFTTEPVTIAESVKKLAQLPLHHHPGERFTYSEGLDVLGYFIELVSGKPFDVFLRERLFEPLGMTDTGFYLSDAQAPRLVPVQKFENEQWVRFPVTFYDPDYPIKGAKRFFSGGAGLCSTAKDYATFLQMYVNDGRYNGKRILSRTTIETIMANQVPSPFGSKDKNYGLAFGIVTDQGVAKGGLGRLGTFDWGGYFNTQYFADPREGTVGVLMKQTQGAEEETGWQFRLLVGTAIDD